MLTGRLASGATDPISPTERAMAMFNRKHTVLDRLVAGRTDLVFDYVAQGGAADTHSDGASVIDWCARYGDVSAIRFLLANGERVESLGENLGLDAAAFFGH